MLSRTARWWRWRWRWLAWTWVGIVTLFNLKLTGGQQCSECLSGRGWTEWRIGIWNVASIPLFPRFHWDVVESNYARDFGLGDHEHTWRGGGHTARVLFGTVAFGYACGGAFRGWANAAYENDPAFRDLVAERLRAGTLTKDQVRALVVVEQSKQDSDTQRLESLLLDEYAERQTPAGRL